jgi:dihydrofolate reductase
MKLVITENITLDGVIDSAGGWFAPAGDEFEADSSDVVAALQRQMANDDAVLFGRVTFEEMRGYWALQTDDTTGVTDHLNKVPKYVVSSSLDDPEWENTTVVRGKLEEEVQALRDAPGRDVVVTGSISVCRQLIASSRTVRRADR